MKNVILIIGGFNLPYNNASAIRAISLARCLRIIGYSPVVVGIMSNSDDSWGAYEDIVCYNMKGVARIASNINFVFDIQKKYPTSSIYAIIAYNYPGVALSKLLKYAHENKIKMVSDITEWYAWEFNERGVVGAFVRKFQTEYRMRYLNKKISNIICSTNYIADYYKNCHTMVLPAIDDSSFNEKKCVNTSVTNKPRRFFYAGSPGYKFRKDRINIVVQLFERLSKEVKEGTFVFDVYGVKKEEYETFFPYPRVRKGEIVFHGRAPRNEIMKILPSEDFYILLRPNNLVCKVGFSTKSMEAISAGVPLLANDVNGDFSLYFKDGQALLCDADDINGFYLLLKVACSMPDEEILRMKESCVNNNPFNYKNYIGPFSEFMSKLC